MSCKIILPILLIMVLAFVLVRCSSKRPGNIGLVDGGLRKCPQSPNCVSSRAADGRHGIAPITFSGPVEAAREKLVSVIASMPRAKIAESAGPYLRAEFSSALFRFVDDAEFLMDEGAQVIHVRSASRVGYSDMGVNRRRVEEIRTLFGGAGNSR